MFRITSPVTGTTSLFNVITSMMAVLNCWLMADSAPKVDMLMFSVLWVCSCN